MAPWHTQPPHHLTREASELGPQIYTCHLQVFLSSSRGDIVGFKGKALLHDAPFRSIVFLIMRKAASSLCEMACLCQRAM